MTILYEAKTGHTKEVLKAYTRVYLEMENGKTTISIVLIGAAFLMMPKVFEFPRVASWLSWGFGMLILVIAMIRPYLIYVNMMTKDPYYMKNTEIELSFGNSQFEVRDGEKRVFKYHLIRNLYEDKKMFYLEMEDQDLFIIPKQDFVQGTPENFTEFLQLATDKKFEDIHKKLRQKPSMMEKMQVRRKEQE